MTPASSFLSTYAAVRFSTGKKAPGVVWPLMKAFGLICYCTLILPIHLLRLLLEAGLRKAAPVTPPHQTTANGYPRSFQHHIDDLQEDMK